MQNITPFCLARGGVVTFVNAKQVRFFAGGFPFVQRGVIVDSAAKNKQRLDMASRVYTLKRPDLAVTLPPVSKQ
jgi:sporulation-control protein spo0M